MGREITDFPSDPYGETGDLRRELLKALQRADMYPSKCTVIKKCVQYANTELGKIARKLKGKALELPKEK